MNKSIKVDQIVFVKRINNAARHHSKDELVFQGKIIKIGNKYFCVRPLEMMWKEIKFRIDNFCEASEYCPDYKAYLSQQDIKDEEEYEEKLERLRLFFRGYGTIDIGICEIRKIHGILFEEETKCQS
jgi:hypothetical protein